jgi:hypothetical protein
MMTRGQLDEGAMGVMREQCQEGEGNEGTV